MSERYVTVVRRRHVRYREMVVLTAAIATLIVLVVGFLLGQHAALSGIKSKEAPLAPAAPVIEVAESCDQVEQELMAAVHEAGVQHEVDVAALELARKDLLARDERVAELESSLAFFRGLMLPSESRKGVSVISPQWVAGDTPGLFLFRMVVQQISREHKKVDATLTVTLIGEQAGDATEIPLHTVSDSHPQKEQKLNFKYFQVVEGQLSLPSGFTPHEVRVDLKMTKPRRATRSQTFTWQLQEAFRHERQ